MERQLGDALGYEDLKVTHEWRTWRDVQRKDDAYQHSPSYRPHWYVAKHGREALDAKVAALEAGRRKTALFRDPKGLWTYSGLATRLKEMTGEPVVMGYQRPEHGLVGWQSTPHEPRWYQTRAEELLVPMGHGAVELACHRGDDRVLMHDGTTKAASEVAVGDALMGPDSSPRHVTELHTGFDEMYRITTTNGQTMVVNGAHILVLRQTCKKGSNKQTHLKRRKDFRGANPTMEISVRDYLERAKKNTFKHIWKLFSVGVEFPSQLITVDPYSLGVLLGDGSLKGSVGITTMDQEIADVAADVAATYGLRVRVSAKLDNKAKTYYIVGSKNTKNPLVEELRGLGVYGTSSGDKFIPHTYKVNSVAVRTSVLAGLIDTDGSYEGGCYTYTTKSQRLANDFAFVARSLGLRATLSSTEKYCQTGGGGRYWRVCISGDLEKIPVRLRHKKAGPRLQKKNVSSFGFSVEKLADNERFYGWSLTGDRRYLTDSFLVTHNTGLGKSLVIARLLWRIGLPGIVVAPTLSIAGQLHADLVRLFGRQHVGQFFDGKKQADKKFVVAVSKSLTNLEAGSPLAEALGAKAVLIGDESHLLPAETLARVVLGLLGNVPYRFFLSGTQLRSDGLDLLLEGITGDIVLRMDVRQGVDEGFLTKPRFFQFQIWSDRNYDVPDPIKMNRVHLHDNPKVYEHAGGLIKHALRAGRRPLVLVEEVPQFGRLLPFLGGVKAGFAHGGVNKDNRDSIPKAHHRSDPMALVQAFDAGELACLVGTQTIGTGTDIKTASFVVDLVGLASEVRVRQNVGRGTRVHPSKKDFIYVDYDIRNQPTLSRHAAKRAKIFDDIYGPVKYMKAM